MPTLFTLTITDDQILSTNPSFDRNDLTLGDNYVPVDVIFEKHNGDKVKRNRNPYEKKISNQTLPRLACQVFENQLLALSAEDKADFPVCQYRTSGQVIRGIFPNEEDYRRRTGITGQEIMKYENGNCHFFFYSWNIFSTLLFVQECLSRWGQEGDKFVLTYREKNPGEPTVETEDTNLENRDEAMSDSISPKIRNLLESNLNVILTGAPGTGKTHAAREVAKIMVGAILPENPTDADKANAARSEEERVRSVQFHPGYDYADFVVGMKPVLISAETGKEVFRDENGIPFTTDTGRKDGARTPFSGKTEVSFRWTDGVFKTFADKAKKAYDDAPDKNRVPKFVFLIDEINRADLSRVFGELFSLLEEEYRYPNDRGTGITLPNGDSFVIPKNLYIIGTMNDIDRSVESMDFALRRRFAWKEVGPDETADEILAETPQKETLRAKMDAVNAKIRSDDFRLGSEYQLGAAVFAKFKGDYEDLWNNRIANILSEYLRGRRDRSERLQELKEAYDQGTGETEDAHGDEEGEEENASEDSTRTRGPNKKFRIVFQDGTVIGGPEQSGADTLVEFIRHVGPSNGFDQIAARVSPRGGKPFLKSGVVEDAEARNYKQVAEGWSVCVYSGTDEKKSQINQIIHAFQIEATVEDL